MSIFKLNQHIRDFSLKKIIPKIGVMIVLFLTILTGYTIGIYIQNKKSLEVVNRIEDVRIPVRAIVNEILIGTSKLAANQRGYFMSGDIKYKGERLEIWEKEVAFQVKRLLEFQKDLSATDQENVNVVIVKLNQYKVVQDELEQFYDENIAPVQNRIQLAQASDTASKDALLADLLQKAKLDHELHELIYNKSRKLRQDYQKILQTIKDTQEKDLHVETEQINTEIMVTNSVMISALIIATIVWAGLGYLVSRSLKKSIQKPVDMLTKLQAGELPDDVQPSEDELNAIIAAGNKVIHNMKSASLFAKNIGEGNFDHTFHVSGENDVLGNSLIQMRDKLQQVTLEDKKRNWITHGLAELGDILRKTEHMSGDFYATIVSFIVKYVNANQGGLFVTQNNQLELMACYAFNRRKYLTKTVQPGEGLVGQAYLEKEFIFLKEVPVEYLRVTSGLGDAPPRCILICPLVLKDQVYGILELASFTVFGEHQIELVKKLCEQLASVVSTEQINQQTARLLLASQQQAEELRAQEEEMRQNMEELAATQEEMFRKEQEYLNRIRELEEKTV
ncbi:GAF domain-containing protein [Cytophagaceae bacterium YF14B1]|uniref:GAF domain-containing protein n=1 Tax=Xanthocytophaga flava TaxID=3048013 RepID=A0AAE3QXD1_9BACT|nr:GAF domain-containing protein [Xanthocytophaga flavus]MDJ1485173.1 GAF domain-containing protein [Xanthocytophaga flavus]